MLRDPCSRRCCAGWQGQADMDPLTSPTDPHEKCGRTLCSDLYQGLLPANQLQSLDAQRMSEQSPKLPRSMAMLNAEHKEKTGRNQGS